MKWPWHNYAKGSRIKLARTIKDILLTGKASFFKANDKEYLWLNEAKLKAFVYRYHVSTNIVWKKESSDCDDYALLAQADVIRGAIEQNFERAVCFGRVSFSNAQGGRHMMNWAMTAEGKVLFFEPQTGKWSDWLLGKDYDFEL